MHPGIMIPDWQEIQIAIRHIEAAKKDRCLGDAQLWEAMQKAEYSLQECSRFVLQSMGKGFKAPTMTPEEFDAMRGS